MEGYSNEDIKRMVEEDHVEFIRLQFTDILGHLKNVAVTKNQLNYVLNNKLMFDGSSIEGFVRIEESDMYLRPDPSTYTILPWRPADNKVARMICNVYDPEGYPFAGDPRHCLKKVLEEAEEKGYKFNVGTECEFFVFHTKENGRATTKTHDISGYFDLGPLDLGGDLRREICLMLEKMGYELEASHHEVAPGQHEIDFKYHEALKAADDVMTFKLLVKTLAKKKGLCATFMAKPKSGVNGSGMHTNMSLMKDGKNIFYDAKDPKENGLSREAYLFISGILNHIHAMTAICNPTVNSYKRLLPGYEAPIYEAWSCRNRSPLIRIPASRGSATRVELRSPDPTANPYLVLALCLKAGLEGIEKGVMPPESVDVNLFEMSIKELEELKIRKLPQTLYEAVEAMKEDPFMKDTLGEHIYNTFIEMKEKEWAEYQSQVSRWEKEKYLAQY